MNIGPEAKKVLNDLKNKVAHGKPIDTNHEGMSHLTPSQQTAVKGLLRRRKNGEKLPQSDKKTLQNLQNLMVNGKPLDENHPGYKKLKPKEQANYDKLKAAHVNSRNMSPDSVDKLEKMARSI